MIKTKKERNKDMNKGITLIALVITIIVLLILAAVSIATLTGENGILTRANDAKTSTEIAEEKEKVELATVAALADDNGGEIKEDYLKQELEKYFGTDGVSVTPGENNGEEGFIVTIDDSGRQYFVDKDGNVEELGTGVVNPPSEEPDNPDDNGIFQETSTINGGEATANNPTIPAGFRPMDTETSSWGHGTSAPSAEDLGNGLVITDAPKGEDGNEFVWIPVGSISEIANATTGTDSNGNQNYQGKLYDFTSTGATEKTSYREPDTVSSYDGNSTYLDIIKGILKDNTDYNADNYASIDKFKTTMQEDYNAMIKSVEEYGGFYIGRYEISKTSSNTAQSKKNSVALTAEENSANKWYGLYAYGKKYTNPNNPNSVESSMIWGSQYDAMMRWMQDNDVDVTGNIGDNRNTGTTTGTSETDIINNIYDLYGCHYEWTLEANDTVSRVSRGRLLQQQLFTKLPLLQRSGHYGRRPFFPPHTLCEVALATEKKNLI